MRNILWSSNLKCLRGKQKKSQEEMAASIGFTNTQWSNWESKNAFPNVLDMIKISDYFGFKIDELIYSDLTKVELEEVGDGSNEIEKLKKSNAILEDTLHHNINLSKQLLALKDKEIELLKSKQKIASSK